jgi:replicative DNA helicase
MGLFHEVLNSNNIRRPEAGCPASLRAPERMAPAALDSERLLLGSVLLDPDQLLAAVEALPPGQAWFYNEAHRLVYDALLTLFERRDPIDLQSVTEVLHRRGHLEKAGGSVALAELLESVATTANTAYHARLIREKALYRSLINLGTQLTSSAYAQDELPAIPAEAHQGLLQVANAQTGGSFSSLQQLIQHAIHAAQHADARELTGLDTGFPDLNEKTSGFQPSDLVISAARPGLGKTALAMHGLSPPRVTPRVRRYWYSA